MMIIKDRYVEIVTLDELKERRLLEKDLQSLKKDLQIPDLQIPLERENSSSILNEIESRIGKMCIEDIAHDLNIKTSTVRKYRKEILSKLDKEQKEIILRQEQKIEELREKILAGKMEKRPHNYTFGIEGLIRGIVRDLTKEGKSVRQIKEQIHIDTSTISYHRRKIKEKNKRKYPPRIMNMIPNKLRKVRKLLEKHKKQKDICDILNISSATASVIVNKIKNNI